MPTAATIEIVGNWDRQMQVPLENAIAATIELTGRSGREACKMAMVYMARSARRDTPISKKLRPVIRNPNQRWKTDRRVAPWGVMVYSNRTSEGHSAAEATVGQAFFRPIYRTGEFGKIRFFDKRSMSWFKRDAANPKGKWEKIASGPDVANPEIIVPGIMTDRRRKIGNRGLARRSWMWGLRAFGLDEGDAEYKGVKPDVQMHEVLDRSACGYVMVNRLRYINKIMPEGFEETLASRASNQIMAQAARRMEQDHGVLMHRLADRRTPGRTISLPDAWRAAR